VTIIHETHRGKFSFAVHSTRKYLEAIPSLRLNLDISHWYTVAESYLDDQQRRWSWRSRRTAHIHARVGHKQGPQVSDPVIRSGILLCRQHLLAVGQGGGKASTGGIRGPGVYL